MRCVWASEQVTEFRCPGERPRTSNRGLGRGLDGPKGVAEAESPLRSGHSRQWCGGWVSRLAGSNAPQGWGAAEHTASPGTRHDRSTSPTTAVMTYAGPKTVTPHDSGNDSHAPQSSHSS